MLIWRKAFRVFLAPDFPRSRDPFDMHPRQFFCPSAFQPSPSLLDCTAVATGTNSCRGGRTPWSVSHPSLCYPRTLILISDIWYMLRYKSVGLLGKCYTNHTLNASFIALFPPGNGGLFRSIPYIQVDESPARGSNLWRPRESKFQVRRGEVQLFP